MNLAIFDIDGTLVEGSTERRFWRYLLKRGHQGPRQVVAYLLFLLRYWPVYRRPYRQEEQGVSRGPRDGSSAALWLRASSPRRFFRVSMRQPYSGCRATCGAATPWCCCPERSSPSRGRSPQRLAVEHVRATICCERDGRYLAAPPGGSSIRRREARARRAVRGRGRRELDRSDRLRGFASTISTAAASGGPSRGRDAGSAAARDGTRQPLAHHPSPKRTARLPQ